MTLTECQEELLGHLASMPFLDRLELVAVSGWSRGSVYESVEKFEADGLAASVPHATDVTPPTRRFYLTPSGLHRLARVEGMTVDELLNLYPVSARWQRILLERLDAAAVIYRLAATISNIAHPIRFRWYRAMPMDAAIVLPDERIIGVVRQGLTSDRTAFSKRLWRLRDGPSPSAILVLLPDEVWLRQARRLLAGAPAASFLALERDAVSADPSTPVWRIPSDSVSLDLSRALKHTSPNGELPTEEPPERVSLPEHLKVDGQDDSAPDHLLPALLRSTEKRCLDLLSDWPWMTPAHLGGVLEVKRSRISQLLQRLTSLGLVIDDVVEGRRRLILSDLGLSVLARRDRTSVGAMKKRWSASLTDPDRAATWRNVSGARARQLLRNIEHTDAVHWFIAVLAKQARSRGRELAQLDSPGRASRYFRYAERLHSVRPDAFGLLHNGQAIWPFFLEWERRAVRPVTMAARIAPYLRYYSTHRPTDDHGAQPSLLVVFDDDVAETHFLRIAKEEMDTAKVQVPLFVAPRNLLEKVGPLGPAWRTPDRWEPIHPFNDP